MRCAGPRMVPVLFLPLVAVVVLFEPLFLSRSLLSFDNRMQPPFRFHLSAHEPAEAMNLVTSDINGWILPETLVQVERLKQGQAPLWNPGMILGQPLLANQGFVPYYPTTLLYLGLAPLRAYAISVALHLVLLSAGAYRWLRRERASRAAALVGAIALAYCAFLSTRLHLPHFLRVAAWLPWLLLSLRAVAARRGPAAVAAAGLCVGLSLLAGFPQLALIQVYFAAALYVVWCHRTGRGPAVRAGILPLAASLVLGGLLAAVHLFPATELLGHSLRREGASEVRKERMVLEPESLVGLVSPAFFGDPIQDLDPVAPAPRSDAEFPTYRRFLEEDVQNNFVENSVFVGLAPLLLALVALLRRPTRGDGALLLLIVASLAVASGLPGVHTVASLLPGLSTGSPKRVLWISAVGLVWLSVRGFDRLLGSDRPPRARGLWVGGVAAVALGSAALLWLRGQATANPDGAWLAETISPDAVRFVGFGLALLAVAASLRRPTWARGLVVAVAALDLIVFARLYNPDQRLEDQYATTPGIEFLRERSLEPPSRYLSFQATPLLPGSLGQVFGLRSPSGVAALMVRESGELLHRLDPGLVDLEDPRVVGALQDPAALDHPLLRLTGTRFVLVGSPEAAALLVAHPDYEQIYADAEREWMAIFESRRTLPPAFAVQELRLLPDREERLAWLSRRDYDPSLTAVVEQAPGGPPRWSAAEVVLQRPDPEHLRVAVQSEGPAFVVISETFLAGWRAELDGQPVELLRVDHAFMGAPVPAGEHVLTLRYRPRSFLLGAWCSMASAVALMILLVVRKGATS